MVAAVGSQIFKDEPRNLNKKMEEELITAVSQATSRTEVTKLPEFHGDRSKDKLKASAFIKRVESAAEAGKWTNRQKISFFRLALVGRAEDWYDITIDRSKPEWELKFDDIATDFVLRFEPSAVGNRNLACLKEINQKQNESVQDFADRLMRIALDWRRAIPLPPVSVEPEQKAYTRLGMRLMAEHILLTLFLLGLKSPLKEAVRVQCPAIFQEALDLALDFEAGKLSLKTDATEEQAKIIAMIEEQNQMIAALKAQTAAMANKTSGGGKKFKVEPLTEAEKKMTCFYCKKPGHPQKKCFTRLRKGDPINLGSRRGRASAIKDEDYNGEDEEDNDQIDDSRDRVCTIDAADSILNFLGAV